MTLVFAGFVAVAAVKRRQVVAVKQSTYCQGGGHWGLLNTSLFKKIRYLTIIPWFTAKKIGKLLKKFYSKFEKRRNALTASAIVKGNFVRVGKILKVKNR